MSDAEKMIEVDVKVLNSFNDESWQTKFPFYATLGILRNKLEQRLAQGQEITHMEIVFNSSNEHDLLFDRKHLQNDAMTLAQVAFDHRVGTMVKVGVFLPPNLRATKRQWLEEESAGAPSKRIQTQ
jgi:hypothetical protein